ncbi:hypothetical protein [Pseudoalteromonas xiamenensis]
MGGAIAIHRLCDLLNQEGCEAYLWSSRNYPIKKCDEFNTPELITNELNDFIVVYMDVVSGNPVGCPNVVRWFLNKPGFFTEHINYGVNELYFHFQEVFKHPLYPSENLLYVVYFLKNIYFNKNLKNRAGSCYMLRKGRGRKIIHDLTDSILIDDKGHQEIADIFNSRKYFYCYDLHSAYTYFASLCGCTPIVIPENSLSEHEWQPDERLRFGVAYGDSELQISYAKKTANELKLLLEQLEKESLKYVRNFIELSQKFFKKIAKHRLKLKARNSIF